MKTKKSILSILLGLVGLAFFLIGCAQAVATEAPAELEDTADEATSTAPVTAVVDEAASVDYCIECHSDKDQLINTASPEEEAISENEGEG